MTDREIISVIFLIDKLIVRKYIDYVICSMRLKSHVQLMYRS